MLNVECSPFQATLDAMCPLRRRQTSATSTALEMVAPRATNCNSPIAVFHGLDNRSDVRMEGFFPDKNDSAFRHASHGLMGPFIP